MFNLVSKIENVLLTEPLDAVCSMNVVYLTMNSNNLGKYEDVKTLADSAMNSALTKVTDIKWRIKILKILAEVNDVLIIKFFLYIQYYDETTIDELYSSHC
jgi:hypothetical protein